MRPMTRTLVRIGCWSLLVGVAACHTPQPATAAGAAKTCPSVKGAHWGYAGEVAPEHWAELDPQYQACNAPSGQSPIDIRDARVDPSLPPLELRFLPGKATLVDNGHSIQVNVDGSRGLLGGKRYRLLQFHFHSPSEHAVDGKHADMEIHMVLQADDCSAAVLSVLLMAGDTPNPLIERLWSKIPAAEERVGTTWPLDDLVDPAQLLPADRGYFTYEGSLTTPPCAPSLPFFILRTPVPVSTAQVERFRAALGPSTARPIHPTGDRVIRQSAR